jgi:hypothetical protein
MLQRVFYENLDSCDFESLFEMTEDNFVTALTESSPVSVKPLLVGLFGTMRSLYKRLAQASYLDDPEMYDLLARRPYGWLVDCSRRLAEALSSETGMAIPPEHVLIDAPPAKLEVQFDLDVYYPKTNHFRALGEVSPVVRTLAETQFDRIVKRVRIFIHPNTKRELPPTFDVTSIVKKVASTQ